MIARIKQVRYEGGSTATNLALDALTNSIFIPGRGARSGHPRVAIVITDGRRYNTPHPSKYLQQGCWFLLLLLPVFGFVSQLLTSVRLCFSVARQCSVMFLSCSPVFDYVSQLLAGVRFCFSVARQCSVMFLSCSPVFGYVSQLLTSIRLCFSVIPRRPQPRRPSGYTPPA